MDREREPSNNNSKSEQKLDGKIYWIISAPKTNEDTFNTLNKKTSDEQDLSVSYKFSVPLELKTGTLNSLMSLSDDLVKVDAQVENVTRKIASQLFDLLEAKADKYESLSVNNNNIDTYVQYFRWDEAKYPISLPLQTLTENLFSQVSKLDEELKAKSSEYNSLTHSLNQEERKQSGNLSSKDLSDVIVPDKHIIKSEYLTTMFVAVPKYNTQIWLTGYEKFHPEYVLPRSSQLVAEDGEYGLYTVTLFKKVVEDFKNACRERKFVIREYNVDDQKKVGDKKKLEAEREKLKKTLVRWCKTNFSEAFVAWIHLKAVRVFVESVLRYGLPTNFQAMLLLPHKGKNKKLRKVLHELYGHLSTKAVFSKDDDEETEKFFPYVFLEANLDLRKVQNF